MQNEFSRNDIRAILAEGIGTLFFVFLSAGSVVAALAVDGGALTTAGLLIIAFGHGIGIITAVAWTANLSGGHINPAVTIAMLITQNIRPALGAAYIIAQFVGGALGGLLLKLATSDPFEGTLGTHAINQVSNSEALLLEIVLTFFLVLVVYNVAVSRAGWGTNAPLAIGMSVTLIHLAGIPWTGPSVNPARSFGAALAANEWGDIWVHLIGPAIGGALMGAFWLFWRTLGDDALDTPGAPAALTDQAPLEGRAEARRGTS